MKTTLGEIKNGMNDKVKVWYLPTGFGSPRVRGIDNNYMVLTGQDLSQRSYACGPDTKVYDSPEEASEMYKHEMEALKAIE